VRSPLPDHRRPDGNLFARSDVDTSAEFLEPLAVSGDVLVERIVSTGHATAPGEWLEQARDEWVVLLEGDAEIRYEDGTRLALGPGDHVVIPAGTPHRVERTSADPPCVWVAVHSSGLEPVAASTR
jgi:cupin 2 domain-containing protein